MKLFIVASLLFLSAVISAQEVYKSKNNIVTTGCQIVEKSFINKAGKGIPKSNSFSDNLTKLFFVKLRQNLETYSYGEKF